MKGKMNVKRLGTKLFLAICFCVMLQLISSSIYAKEIREINAGQTTYYVRKGIKSFSAGYYNAKKITNCSSSDKNVVKVTSRKTSSKKDGATAKYYNKTVVLNYKGEGETTVKYTVFTNDGDEERYTEKAIFKNYSNVMKSIKIGSKEYKDAYTDQTKTTVPLNEINNKTCKFKLQPGWKVENIYLVSDNNLIKLKNKKSFKTKVKKGNIIAIIVSEGNKNDFGRIEYDLIVK